MAGTSFELFGDASNLLTELKKSEKAFTDLNKTAERSGQGIDDVMNKLEGLAKVAGVSFGAAGMAALAKKVADVRGEFQQLEIAFGTMLGSTDKANKLMIQLANTAAKTPFDLQGIAQGAKQLIAYGVAAEEINSTIVSLGDVAAGLSLPLNDLVYLYGTTMVQGKMFTNDLKQLQGRGVPILDALADQLDIAKNEVSEYVSAGRVSADVFKAAMLSMSQEGGKFAGLMAAQSASITGQISNIQDGIAMMFNEIGQQSEGAINGILSGVSALVENYEVVGKSIVALAGTYGMYKAALVVVTALENARNLQAKFVVVNNGKQIGLMKLLTAATWKQVKAQLASNAAMLANPAVLVTAGIVALVGAIVGLNKLISISADEMGRANKQHQKRIEKIDEEKNKAYELIGVIEDETSSYYELAAARGELNELEAFKGMNVKSMTGEQIRARIKEWEELEIAAANAKQKEDAINIVGSARQKYVQADGTLQNEDKVLESAKNARKLLIDEEVENLPVEYDARIKYIEDRIKEEEDLLKQSNEKLAELDSSWWDRATGKAISGQQRDDLMAGATYDQEMSSFALTQWKSVLENTTGQKLKDDEKASEDNKGESLAKVVEQIKKQEQEVYKARKAYSDKNSALNKTNLEKEESNLKTLTDKYQLATGESWKDSKKMEEEITKAKQSAANERAKIDISAIRNERMRRAAEYDQQIKEIEQEEEAYKKSHNGRTSGEFNVKRENARIQYDLDIKEIDREFNEWIEDIQRETIQINTEVEISKLERAIDLADDYNTKLEKRKEINQKQIETKNADLDREMQETAESRFGEETIKKYNRYKSGEYKVDTESETGKAEQAVFDQMDVFYTEFENKRNAIIGQMQQEHSMNILQQDLSDYEEYCNEIIAATREREEAIAAIRNGQETNRTIDMVEDDYKARVGKAGEKHGIDAAEKNATDIVARLVNSLADVTYDQVETAAQTFYDELGKQKEMLETVKGMSANERAAESQTTQVDVDRLKLELENNALPEEQRLAILDELAAKEQYLVYLKSTDVELDNQLVKLGETRKNMESVVANARLNSGKKTQEQIKKENKQYEVTIQSLQLVRDTANSVADTFGGALSKKGKKALETISQVADFGISAVEGIGSTVKGVQDAMTAAGATAFAQLSALEKASVILMIISTAVQLAMKIAEIASQFTKSAQLQNSIDDHLAKVDELQKRQQLIESQYATSQGSEYYKGLVKSGNEYKEIIEETKAALADAEALYNHNLATYGADSDKTKDAKAQLEDIQQQDQDNVNAEIEHWRSLMEEISGTSLDSFAENLADALIEGFAQGKEGIDDVWGDTMDDLLRTMMRNQLAIALKDQFKDAFTSLENATKEDGVLSDAEMQEFMNNLEAGKETAEQIAGAYYDAMSEAGLLNDADAEGSEGFGQMTQDQADTLTARFTAIQIEMSNVAAATQAMAGVVSLVTEDVKVGIAGIQSLLYNSNIALQMAQDQLDQMQIIADNTAMLAETNTRLKAIEQNTGRL